VLVSPVIDAVMLGVLVLVAGYNVAGLWKKAKNRRSRRRTTAGDRYQKGTWASWAHGGDHHESGDDDADYDPYEHEEVSALSYDDDSEEEEEEEEMEYEVDGDVQGLSGDEEVNQRLQRALDSNAGGGGDAWQSLASRREERTTARKKKRSNVQWTVLRNRIVSRVQEEEGPQLLNYYNLRNRVVNYMMHPEEEDERDEGAGSVVPPAGAVAALHFDDLDASHLTTPVRRRQSGGRGSLLFSSPMKTPPRSLMRIRTMAEREINNL